MFSLQCGSSDERVLFVGHTYITFHEKTVYQTCFYISAASIQFFIFHYVLTSVEDRYQLCEVYKSQRNSVRKYSVKHRDPNT